MKKRKWFKAVGGALAFMMALTGCSGSSQSSTSSAGTSAAASSKDVIKVGMSFATMENDVFVDSKNYLTKFGEQSNPKIEFTFTVADDDINKQTADVKDLISRKEDAIVIIPVDSRAIESSIIAVKNAKIPCITFNRPQNKSLQVQPDSFVGLDSEYQGYATGLACLKKMKTDGKTTVNAILVNGDLSDENSTNRANGFKTAAKEATSSLGMKVNVLAELPSKNWDPTQSAANLGPALKAHPDVNLVFVSSDGLLAGVQSSLSDIGRWVPTGDEKHVYIASCDVFKNGISFLSSKYIDTDSLFDIVNQSKKTIEVIKDLVNGKSVESYIAIKGPVFDQSNYNKADMQSLLWNK